MDHKGNLAVIVVSTYSKVYMQRLQTVLALSESIYSAAEGFFLDGKYYNCTKRFVKHK